MKFADLPVETDRQKRKKDGSLANVQHEKAIDRLARKPELIGIKGVECVLRLRVFRNGCEQRGADLAFYTGQTYRYPWHIVEFKLNPENGRNDALDQLNRTAGYIRNRFGGRCYKHLVWKEGDKYFCETMDSIDLRNELCGDHKLKHFDEAHKPYNSCPPD